MSQNTLLSLELRVGIPKCFSEQHRLNCSCLPLDRYGRHCQQDLKLLSCLHSHIEMLRKHCDFVEIKYQQLLDHSSVCWLWLMFDICIFLRYFNHFCCQMKSALQYVSNCGGFFQCTEVSSVETELLKSCKYLVLNPRKDFHVHLATWELHISVLKIPLD